MWRSRGCRLLENGLSSHRREQSAQDHLTYQRAIVAGCMNVVDAESGPVGAKVEIEAGYSRPAFIWSGRASIGVTILTVLLMTTSGRVVWLLNRGAIIASTVKYAINWGA